MDCVFKSHQTGSAVPVNQTGVNHRLNASHLRCAEQQHKYALTRDTPITKTPTSFICVEGLNQVWSLIRSLVHKLGTKKNNTNLSNQQKRGSIYVEVPEVQAIVR